MKWRWWLVIALVLVFAAALAIGIPALTPPQQGITYANFGRIHKGMPRDEVIDILGRPNLQDDGDDCAWRNDAGDIVGIEFDREGRVRWYAWNDVTEERATWQKLRDRMLWFAKPPPRPQKVEEEIQ